MKSSPCTKSFLLPKIYCSSSNCIWPEVQRGWPAPALGRNTDGCCRRCVKYGHYSQHCICFQTSALNYCHLVHLKLGWVSAKLCSERCLDEDESCYVVVLVCWYPQRGVSREQSKKLTFGLLLWTTDTTDTTHCTTRSRECHPATLQTRTGIQFPQSM